MTDPDLTEYRLRRMFAAVAAELPAQPNGIDIESVVVGSERHNPSGVTTDSSRKPGRRRLMKGIGMAGVLVAGSGIAAAAGWLPAPWSSVPGSSFLDSMDPAATQGAVVRLSAPGPESTVLQVVTDVTYKQPGEIKSCVTMAITGSEGVSEKKLGAGSCDGMSAPPGDTVPADFPPAGISISRNDWSGPSGVSYVIFIGQTVPTAAAVALANSQGAVAAKGFVGNDYYVVYLPSAQATTDHYLVFYNAAGKVLDIENLGG